MIWSYLGAIIYSYVYDTSNICSYPLVTSGSESLQDVNLRVNAIDLSK